MSTISPGTTEMVQLYSKLRKISVTLRPKTRRNFDTYNMIFRNNKRNVEPPMNLGLQIFDWKTTEAIHLVLMATASFGCGVITLSMPPAYYSMWVPVKRFSLQVSTSQ
jgi:hypothetical protein